VRRPPSHRHLIVFTCAVGVPLLLLIGIGTYGLLLGPTHNPGAAPDSSAEPTPLTTKGFTPSPSPTSVVPKTADPVLYARAVAELLFTWDTSSGRIPVQYEDPIVSDADPSGYETSGLVADLDKYFPSRDAWEELRQYQTLQSLSIENAYVPSTWPSISAEPETQIAKGTTAVTIEGTRHRQGIGFGQVTTSDHTVTFTIFLVCRPTADRCHTLRLSAPDSPLR
jgi:hypothetical protein